MVSHPKSERTKKGTKCATRPSPAQLNRLIAEAIVDAYNDSEQVGGFYTMMEEFLAFPFTTEVLGVAVTVVGVDLTGDDRIVALCRRGKARQRIPVLDLPLPQPPPKGAEWIHAYRRWRG
jgi:hypothetical protein